MFQHQAHMCLNGCHHLYEDSNDWERTGEEEMNRLHEKCRKPTVLDVRDSLNNIADLVTICGQALEFSSFAEIKTIVSNVLTIHIVNEIKRAEQELRNA